jgi:hypothetical protein
MPLTLENLAAQKKITSEIIGYLFWYTVSDVQKSYEDLEELFQKCGIDFSWMPSRIRAVDAFRRATSSVYLKGISYGKFYYNVLIRDVSCDTSSVTKHIVVETVDEKGKRLDYYPNCGELVFERKTEYLNIAVWDSRFAGVHEVAEKVKELYDRTRIFYEGRHLREVVLNILKSMAPTPVRPSGGVYFVPVKFENSLQRLAGLIKMFGQNSEAYMMPLIDTTEARDMLREKIMEQLMKASEEIEDVAKENSKSKAYEVIKNAESLVSDFKEYKKLLSADAFSMEMTAQELEEKAEALRRKFY